MSLVAGTLVAVLGVLGPGPGALAATTGGQGSLGLSPTVLVFKQALRGQQYSRDLFLVNGGQAAQRFSLATAGPVAQWLSVVPMTGPTVPLRSVLARPAATTTVRLVLRVPAKAANGTYTGRVVVESEVAKGRGGASPVGFALPVEVTAHVTGTEVLAGRLVDAYTYPKVEVGSPVTFFARVHNAGNVAINPLVRVSVTRGRDVVYRHSFTSGPVAPSALSLLHFNWPGSATQGEALGTYHAEVTASFATLKLGAKTMDLQLVPYGSLHRGGKLLGLKLLNHPQVGYSAEVQAMVRSRGEVQQETSFVGQLYRDGVLVAGVRSPAPVLLAPGQGSVMNIPVPVAKNGLYRISGTANFGGAQSNLQTLTFRVGAAPLGLVFMVGAGAAVVVVVALLVLLALLLRRHRRRPPQPQVRPVHLQAPYTPSRGPSLRVPPGARTGTGPGRTGERLRRG